MEKTESESSVGVVMVVAQSSDDAESKKEEVKNEVKNEVKEVKKEVKEKEVKEVKEVKETGSKENRSHTSGRGHYDTETSTAQGTKDSHQDGSQTEFLHRVRQETRLTFSRMYVDFLLLSLTSLTHSNTTRYELRNLLLPQAQKVFMTKLAKKTWTCSIGHGCKREAENTSVDRYRKFSSVASRDDVGVARKVTPPPQEMEKSVDSVKKEEERGRERKRKQRNWKRKQQQRQRRKRRRRRKKWTL